jgi:hypothetical protein
MNFAMGIKARIMRAMFFIVVCAMFFIHMRQNIFGTFGIFIEMGRCDARSPRSSRSPLKASTSSQVSIKSLTPKYPLLHQRCCPLKELGRGSSQEHAIVHLELPYHRDNPNLEDYQLRELHLLLYPSTEVFCSQCSTQQNVLSPFVRERIRRAFPRLFILLIKRLRIAAWASWLR